MQSCVCAPVFQNKQVHTSLEPAFFPLLSHLSVLYSKNPLLPVPTFVPHMLSWSPSSQAYIPNIPSDEPLTRPSTASSGQLSLIYSACKWSSVNHLFKMTKSRSCIKVTAGFSAFQSVALVVNAQRQSRRGNTGMARQFGAVSPK